MTTGPRHVLRFQDQFEAPPETVFDHLTDHWDTLWPGRFHRVRNAADPRTPNGLGSLRRIALPGVTILEEITAYQRPVLLEYRTLRGGPIRDHRGRVNLSPCPTGTRLDYEIRFDSTIPVLGTLIAQALALTWRHYTRPRLHAALDQA
ncbi:SRPBCC family protein [Amycolatopsis nigrescens]|uniref:SRPBCC family protein n=1 Tax=Amycolatopsis nigrescens TaxID=381445 RepID=UPI00036B1248|nr:SRPBCC family protein [Amycolatopsis nigrescens]